MKEVIFNWFIIISIILTGGVIILSLVYLIVRLYFIVFEVIMNIKHLNKLFREFLKEKYKQKVYSPKLEDIHFGGDST